MSRSSQAEKQELLDHAVDSQVTQNTCTSENQDSENVCGSNDQELDGTKESSTVCVLNSSSGASNSEAELSRVESCGGTEVEGKNGKEGEAAGGPGSNAGEEEKWPTPRKAEEGRCFDEITIGVSEVVTAFQEVKSEFKNAVKDARCEFISTVSEVKDELSDALIGSNRQCTVSDPLVGDFAGKDIEGDTSSVFKSSGIATIIEEKDDVTTHSLSSVFDKVTLTQKSLGERDCNCGGQQHPLDLVGIQECVCSGASGADVTVGLDEVEISVRHTSSTMSAHVLEAKEGSMDIYSSQDDEHFQGHTPCTRSEVSDDVPKEVGRDAYSLSMCSDETGIKAYPSSAPSTPVPSAAGSRKVLRAQVAQGRRVSFPEDDTRLISSYLEPVNPWQKMAGVTVEEIAAAYRSSCERHCTQPLPGVLQQIKALPLVVGGRIECISLRGQRLECGQCEGLEEIFRRVQFKILDLEGCSLEDDTAIPLFDMIEFYDSATQLNISCNSRIGVRGWQACARMLKRTPSVEYLDARNTNLNETNMPILGRALRLGARLHTLHLENCNLTCRPLMTLTAALKQNDTLAELYLAENRLGINDCIQLGNLVRVNNTLRVLDLRNNNVQDAGCGHVCEGICEQQKIQLEKESSMGEKKKVAKGLNSLVLWNNHLTQQSAPHLACLLSGSTSLEMVNLGRNNLTSEGILRLKESLLRNRSLLRLGLQAARIADEGAVALAEYTADNTVIQQIDLRENPVRVAGLMALAHSLRLNTTITQMDLDSDPRTEPAVELAEQHLALQKEIKEYCQRNLTRSHLQAAQSEGKCTIGAYKPPEHDRLSVNSPFRKDSLTCETSSKMAHADCRNDLPVREEEKQRYISPAPSPLPSPAPSPCASPSPSPVPSPSRNRFKVFKVQEATRSASQLPLNVPSYSPVVCSSAPVSQSGRSLSAGDLNLPCKQPSSRPNRFSIGGRFTVTRVTEVSGSCSLPSSQVTASSNVTVSSSGSLSSPKIVISSPVRVERGFSVEEASAMASRQNPFFIEKNGIAVCSSSTQCVKDKFDSLPDGHKKAAVCMSGHVVRLKSDSDSDDVFLDATNSSGWSDTASQKAAVCLRGSINDSNSAEKDNDSVSSSELTDSGFLDDSVCGGGRASSSCSPSPSSPNPEGDRDSLLSSSVDSTSQEDAGLGSSSSSSSLQTSPLATAVPPHLACAVQPRNHPPIIEPLKRAPLAAMENGSFDSDSEDSEVTTQSSDSTHSDEVRITTEQFPPRPAWGLKQESKDEVCRGSETSHGVPQTPGSG